MLPPLDDDLYMIEMFWSRSLRMRLTLAKMGYATSSQVQYGEFCHPPNACRFRSRKFARRNKSTRASVHYVADIRQIFIVVDCLQLCGGLVATSEKWELEQNSFNRRRIKVNSRLPKSMYCITCRKLAGWCNRFRASNLFILLIVGALEKKF